MSYYRTSVTCHIHIRKTSWKVLYSATPKKKFKKKIHTRVNEMSLNIL